MPAAFQTSERVRVGVAVAAWTGVLLQLGLSLHTAAEDGQTWGMGLVMYFGYFTVFTNWFVALVCTLPSLAWKSRPLAWLYRPSVAGCATTAILLVGIVYHFLLREVWGSQGLQWVADLILHYVVPAGALAWWWLQTRDAALDWSMPLRWCSYPFIYLGYVMIRGEITGIYPYPFIEAGEIGHGRALLNAFGMIAVFMALGFAVHGIARLRLGRQSG